MRMETLLLLVFLPLSMGLECFFDANTTQITEMPRMVSCLCGNGPEDNVFDMTVDIVNKVSE